MGCVLTMSYVTPSARPQGVYLASPLMKSVTYNSSPLCSVITLLNIILLGIDIISFIILI